jgi:hypothetical protein
LGYFFKNKSNVFATFQQFKAMVENKSDHHIKILRSDRDGEYESNDFCDFFFTNGIQRQTSVAKTLRQNGVAERKNMSIMEMARCMLKVRNLSNQFWAEAV